jgi:hypothetical protein
MSRTRKRYFGHHIVVGHGKPTFLGTRIVVVQVLKQVAKGMSCEAITGEWRGNKGCHCRSGRTGPAARKPSLAALGG